MNKNKKLLSVATACFLPVADALAEFKLEEVVVTARKRAESLQQTPLSVMAFSGDAMEKLNIADLKGLEMKIPNVAMGGAGGLGSSNASFFIRGIGADRNAVNQESAIALYVDDAYYGRSDGALLSVLDVERVEVARGPQGTLFGRSATGGAIRYITKKPTDEFESNIQATLGSENRRDLKVIVNIPLNDDLATRVTAATLNQDGHVEGVFTGQDYGDVNSDLIRGYLRWDAGDSVEVLVSADYTKMDTNGAASVLVGVNDAAPLIGEEAAGGFDVTQLPIGDYDKSYQTGPNFYDSDNVGLNLTLSWEISESLGFRSATSWRQIDISGAYDTDGTYASLWEQIYDRDIEMFSQEFQVSGQLDYLNWLVGVFYYKETSSDIRDVQAGINNRDRTSTRIVDPFEVESTALFGQVAYDFNERWSLTTGLRFTYDDKNISANELNSDGVPLIAENLENDNTWSAISGRVSLEFQATNDVFLFTSVARGFRSGGFNDRIRTDLGAEFNFGITDFDEETLDVFEMGVRSEMLDRRVRFNLTAFYGQYEDMQINSIVPGTVRNVVQNVGESRFSGIEGEFIFALNDVVTLDGALGYLDSEYTDIGSVSASVTTESDFARAPKLSYSLSLSADWDTVSARLDYGWRDDFRSVIADANFLTQEAYGLLNANITYAPANMQWKISVFATNLTDEEYLVSGLEFRGSPRGVAQLEPGRFREFGIKFDWEF